MNIAVCFKQVPDSSTRVRIADDGLQISEEGVSFVINPYDEFAISKAKELADASGGEVTMITVGPDRVTPDIRKAMAQGGNKAIHLKTSDLGDVYSVAQILAEEIKGMVGIKHKINRLKDFHDDLFNNYQKIFSGPAHLTGRMKGFWSYLGPSFKESKKPLKAILKTKSVAKYQGVVKNFFEANPEYLYK